MRLIDADAIDVERISCYYSDNCRLEEVRQFLDDEPTVDPVKHGRWSISSNGLVECSECGEPSLETNYCPHCGAKMDLK